MNIILPDGSVTIVDDDDYTKFGHISWSCTSNGYVRNTRLGSLHRMIMQPPPGLVVDHIDGNPLNNSKTNLRIVRPHENRLKGKDCSARTLPSNVYRVYNRYYGKFLRDGVKKTTKRYNTPQEAAQELIALGYFL